MAIHRNRSFRSTAVVTVFLAACGAPIIMKAAGHRQPVALSTALKALTAYPKSGSYGKLEIAS